VWWHRGEPGSLALPTNIGSARAVRQLERRLSSFLLRDFLSSVVSKGEGGTTAMKRFRISVLSGIVAEALLRALWEFQMVWLSRFLSVFWPDLVALAVVGVVWYGYRLAGKWSAVETAIAALRQDQTKLRDAQEQQFDFLSTWITMEVLPQPSLGMDKDQLTAVRERIQVRKGRLFGTP
jgi:hypothetical protein